MTKFAMLQKYIAYSKIAPKKAAIRIAQQYVQMSCRAILILQ
jgi:hypothetical protein